MTHCSGVQIPVDFAFLIQGVTSGDRPLLFLVAVHKLTYPACHYVHAGRLSAKLEQRLLRHNRIV